MRAGAYPAWRLIREARRNAGLTQKALAEIAGTTQSAVARYEAARTLPDIDTLHRLLAACGQRLELRAVPIDPVDLRQLRESMELTPAEREDRNRRVTKLAADAAVAHQTGKMRPLRGAKAGHGT